MNPHPVQVFALLLLLGALVVLVALLVLPAHRRGLERVRRARD